MGCLVQRQAAWHGCLVAPLLDPILKGDWRELFQRFWIALIQKSLANLDLDREDPVFNFEFANIFSLLIALAAKL